MVYGYRTQERIGKFRTQPDMPMKLRTPLTKAINVSCIPFVQTSVEFSEDQEDSFTIANVEAGISWKRARHHRLGRVPRLSCLDPSYRSAAAADARSMPKI